MNVKSKLWSLVTLNIAAIGVFSVYLVTVFVSSNHQLFLMNSTLSELESVIDLRVSINRQMEKVPDYLYSESQSEYQTFKKFGEMTRDSLKHWLAMEKERLKYEKDGDSEILEIQEIKEIYAQALELVEEAFSLAKSGEKEKAYDLLEHKIDFLIDDTLFNLINHATGKEMDEIHDVLREVLLKLGAIPWVAHKGEQHLILIQKAINNIITIDRVRLYIVTSIKEAFEYVLTGDLDEKINYIEYNHRAHEALIHWKEDLLKTDDLHVSGRDENIQQAAEAAKLFSQIETLISRSFEMKEAGDEAQSLKLLEIEVENYSDNKLLPLLATVLEDEMIDVEELSQDLKQTILNAGLTALFVMLLVAFFIIISTIKIINSIIHPLDKLTKSARIIGSGNLKYQIAGLNGEFDELGAAFNQMTGSLRRSENELIRHQKHLEELVLERTAELEATQKEVVKNEKLSTLGKLTSIVSHELRNPLGVISTSLYTIGEKLKGKEYGIERALARAERNVVRCDNIIAELLDYTRNKNLDLELTPIDPWLDEILDEQKIPDGILLERKLKANSSVYIDREKLRRCVINIFSNAMESIITKEDRTAGDELIVATRLEGDKLVIEITDTGGGIPQQELGKVFEPLFSTKSFGVGLGLPIVKQLIEQHNGGISLESDHNEGTRATIWLPAGENDMAAASN